MLHDLLAFELAGVDCNDLGGKRATVAFLQFDESEFPGKRGSLGCE